jgi:hypothetical protein
LIRSLFSRAFLAQYLGRLILLLSNGLTALEK